MKLKKRLTFILIFFLTVAALVSELYIDSYAWDEKEHNSLMEKVLLGENPVYPVDTGKRNEVIRDLRRASYFAIDFTSEERLAGVAKTNKQNEFKELKKGCWRFAAPKNLTDIAVPGGNGTGRNGDHRKYTHMGWDYDYTDKYNGWEAEQWELRKNILLSTVHKKLDFGVFSSRNNTQCVAFCELLYYTHILGDDISDFEKNAYIEYHLPDDTMWFAGKK